MEVAIDEECTKILATRGPTAADLRLIVAVIKTITDLERIGDEARKIAMLAAHLATEKREHDEYHELEVLAEHVQEMVRDALDAFSTDGRGRCARASSRKTSWWTSSTT